MSIYATLWQLQFPRDGFALDDFDWVTVIAQGVPSHIGTPSPGQGYERGDPHAAYLPPAIPYDPEGGRMRAVVFVLLGTPKGTQRSGQEYPNPLLVVTGDEYDRTSFQHLHGRICTALRAGRGFGRGDDSALQRSDVDDLPQWRRVCGGPTSAARTGALGFRQTDEGRPTR